MIAALVAHHGHRVLDDPQRCAGALMQDYQRQVSLLVAALEHRIPQRLLAHADAGTVADDAALAHAIATLTHDLARALGVPHAGAKWAVESWALAFELLVPHSERRA